jgi:hypothetical protein
VGRGSCACECDYCSSVYSAEEEKDAIEHGREYHRNEKYTSREEAIDETVADAMSQRCRLEKSLLEALGEIPVGYFNDER